MAQMDVSLPEELMAWVEARVAEGKYPSVSDYLGDLARRDKETEEARRRLQAAIDIGRASPTMPYDESVIEDIIARSRDAA
jgi:antitoxin ParD1/3/4